MALNKVLTDEKGVTTNYHRISDVSLRNDRLHCMLESYVSPEYRAADKSAAMSSFNFTITVEEEESMGIRALCYTKIKELPEWADATDC